MHDHGEGLGYNLTQTSMFVGGFWGIFLFPEVKSGRTRIKMVLIINNHALEYIGIEP